MPRVPKRKDAPPPTSDVNPSVVRSGKAKAKQLERIDGLFESYENKYLGLIDPEGIEKLCLDLKVDHTDIRMLMLAWKMKAQKQGYFSKDEWRTCFLCLGVDTLAKLKKALPGLEREVMSSQYFDDFYRYAFQYCLTEGKQRSVDIETICDLLNLVLRSQYHAQVDLLIEFLKVQTDYKVLNLDQWINLYRFLKEIRFPDLENYNSNEAWPVLLDSFVEWLKERRG